MADIDTTQFQDFQKKISHFEQKVEARMGAGSVEKAKELAQAIDPADLEIYGQQSLALTNKIVDAIKADLPTDSPEVQALMEEHFELSQKFQPMTKEMYQSSKELLRDAPEFYETLHPKMPEFLYEAMGHYAKNRWPN